MKRSYKTLRTCRPGITMTELMVSVVAGSIIVLGTWQFFSSSTENARTILNFSHADERIALWENLLAADLVMAGARGSMQTDNDASVCPKPQTLRAVRISDGGALPGHNWGLNTHIDPDVIIIQLPATTSIFRTESMTDTTVTLEVDSELPSSEVEFEQLFTQRTLRITSPETGFHQMVQVTDADFATRILTVSPNIEWLADNGYCGAEGNGDHHEVNVIMHVRWTLIEASSDPADPEYQNLIAIREEVDVGASDATIPGTRLAVVENVVDFQVWGDADTGTYETDVAMDTELGDDQGTATITMNSSTTEALRVVHVQMSVRTVHEFGQYSFRPKADETDLLTTFDIDGLTDTAALALTVGQTIELPNFVFGQLR